MPAKRKFLYQIIALMLMLALIVPLAAACSDDDDEDNSTEGTTTEKTSDSTGPIRIGHVSDWTGAYAIMGLTQTKVINLVKEQLEAEGGLLGGRSIEIVTYDASGDIGQTMAGITKLAQEDKVVAFDFVGVSATTAVVGLEKAEELKRFAANHTSNPIDLSSYHYAIRTVASQKAKVAAPVAMVRKLNPDKVAILSLNLQETRQDFKDVKALLEPEGIDFVNEDYVEAGTADFSPYITKLKRANPDVVMIKFDSPGDGVNVFKAAASMGGWGDIQVVFWSPGSYLTWGLDVAQGTYHYAPWVPGMDTPGSKKFEQAWAEKFGSSLGTAELYSYCNLWVTIEAIRLANSDDPEEIAKAARSGKLQWESPYGLQTFDTNGENNSKGQYVQIVEKKPVIVDLDL